MSGHYRKILLIKPSSLGDIVLALPALSALRKNFPDAQISWLIRPEYAPLIRNHPHLNTIIPFDRKLLGKAWYKQKAFVSLISLINQLRQNRFDLVLDLQGLFRTAFFGWISGCKKRLGMANAREFATLFYTHKIQQNKDCIHLVDYYLKIVQKTGASDIDVRFLFPADPPAIEAIAGLLKDHNINQDNYAVLIPGSAHPDKCWPVENFALLADKIHSQFGLSVIAAGTASEKHICEKLKALAQTPIANFAGLTNLPELTALLKTAKLLVSNDTGPGHIAAALSTPLVLIFGRSNPARVAPYGRENCIAAVEPYSRGFLPDNYDPKYDIKKISVDDVYQKLCTQLQPKKQ
ncbi:glycosyltransferase family 9 protein [Planctomycetota bacterium]